MQKAEPKSTDFLLPTEVQNNPPSTNQVKLTVRSDEARQSSQVDGDFIFIHNRKRKVMLKHCLNCNEEFYARIDKKSKFCSFRCNNNGIKGQRKNNFQKGNIPWNKGKKGFCKGFPLENNPNWKGGITPLTIQIRTTIEYKNWIKNIFQRDNFICQKCNMIGEKLEAHHIKEFSKLFNEFLQQYSQFSPIEDKETLVRLAMTYEPFWDIDNGETLCKKCHRKLKRGKYKNPPQARGAFNFIVI